ncbi:TIGR04423 family type III CRISPR-associated protein [Campylobacter sp. RM13119]|uniref:TIGR04423 family type III CRISPR-associated protein n=1 Tax=Campylobacter californiensis TaxID=1032243 RepID=UPI00147385B2|nr:TIGR04423 family type III CRISPR-associated protein [Campylobacter sp. RM13119]MBE3606711.1 TIGR04423 family type III CRISPR-associated protein [Campylobacter sp. RM13119]
MTRSEVIDKINSLKGYDGYVQLMGEKICKNHVFIDKDVVLSTDSLIYEAHFYSKSENKSICVRQINDAWLVDETDLSDVDSGDICEFYSKFGTKVKMAQIWEAKNDKYCENVPVLKLKKVAFAGFMDDKKDNQ